MAKMKQCKVCSKEIASSAKSCPECGAKNSKPVYKRWWFWLIVVLIIASMGSTEDETNYDNQSSQESAQISENTENENTNDTLNDDASLVEENNEKEDVPTEYKSALKKAKVYSDTMYMSKNGIYDQLTSEYGEKFSKEAAQYAIDNIQVDWKENALKKAQHYQEMMSMSPSAIYDQLISEYGEKFTKEEAQYAIDNLN